MRKEFAWMMGVKTHHQALDRSKAMRTRSRGKKLAVNITTAVTVGSFAVVGIGAIAVDQATVSHGSSATSVTGDDGGAAQNQAPSQDGGSYSQDGGSYSQDGGSYSLGGASPVQPGNGGAVSGRSSGS